MNYKDKFINLIEDNKFDDARIILEENSIYANEDSFYYGNMGWILNHMERYREAEFYLLKGIHLFNDEGWMYAQLGFCYDRLNKYEDGIVYLKKSLEYGFNEKWIYGELGWCLKQLNQLNEAIYILEDALMDDSTNPWILSELADIYYMIGKKDIALEYLLKSYYTEPNTEACIDLVNYYHQEKDYINEIKYLNKIEDSEDEIWKQFQLGNAYMEIKKPDQSLAHLENAERLGKDDTTLHALMGDVYQALQQEEKANVHYNKALSYYEKALLIEKEHDWIFQEMIWIAHKQQDWNKKLFYLKRAYRENNNDLWLMYHFARCYTDLHEYEHAITACEFYLKRNRDSKDVIDLYAWNLGRNKQEERAIDALNYRINKDGADSWTYAELGWNYIQLEKYEEALDVFFKAFELETSNTYYTSMIGYCFYSLMDYETALKYFKKSIILGRNDTWIYITIGETLEILNRFKEALPYYEKAKELGYNHELLDKKICDLKNMK